MRMKLMHSNYTISQPRGISKDHRALLSRLHRTFQSPFSSREAAECLALPSNRTNRLLAYWAARGWLSRIRRGVYITVPLDAINPSKWVVDPWLIAKKLFSPCYIGGWSAAEHWGLTEQIFRDIVVFTSLDTRYRKHEVKNTKYLVVTIPSDLISNTVQVWRESERVAVSNPARTLVDILDKPELGGGIKHISQIASELLSGDYKDETAIIEILRNWGNRTVCKRLGYIIEHCHLDAPDVLSFCMMNISAGYSRLDPSIAKKGILTRRWMLEINSTLSSDIP